MERTSPGSRGTHVCGLESVSSLQLANSPPRSKRGNSSFCQFAASLPIAALAISEPQVRQVDILCLPVCRLPFAACHSGRSQSDFCTGFCTTTLPGRQLWDGYPGDPALGGPGSESIIEVSHNPPRKPGAAHVSTRLQHAPVQVARSHEGYLFGCSSKVRAPVPLTRHSD